MTESAVGNRTEVCYLRIRDDIVSGVFTPGDVLLETTLTTTYGVSRTPVREALGRLERDGLLQRVIRGFEVPRRGIDEILDIYNVRIALEVIAVESACERASRRDLTALGELHQHARESSDRTEKLDLNRRWHLQTVALGQNKIASEMLSRTVAMLAPYSAESIEVHENLDDTDAEHLAIMTAIAEHDSATAGTLLRRHLERVRDVRIAAWKADVRRRVD